MEPTIYHSRGQYAYPLHNKGVNRYSLLSFNEGLWCNDQCQIPQNVSNNEHLQRTAKLSCWLRDCSESWLHNGFVTRVKRRVPHVEQELFTLPGHPSSHSIFSGVRVARSLVFCVLFCRSLFVLLSFLFWPLCCLFFFDLRILITPLVLSNFLVITPSVFNNLSI
jgi:hypothetical protein